MSSGLYEGGIKALAAEPSRTSLPDPECRVSLDNPFCGDRVDLEVNIEGGRITSLAHKVRGCLLCRASANVVAKSAIGLSLDEVEIARAGLEAMLKGTGHPARPPPGWEPLVLFEPVSRHKSRHGCVTLPFTALLKALS